MNDTELRFPKIPFICNQHKIVRTRKRIPPVSYQALAIGKNSFDHKIAFEVDGKRIECENDVKLLGVTVDYQLNIYKHISETCKKVSDS